MEEHMDTAETGTTEERHSKAELLSEIDTSWAEFNAALDRLTEEQMTAIRDPHGWSVKDHLVHLAAWERSVAVLLQGRPRHEGLGVTEDVWLTGDDDTINAAIQAERKDIPLSEARTELREVHGQLMSLIEPMTGDDLYKANSDFLPGEPGERDERPVIGMIYGNTADHFREHQGWIESLVSQRS